MTDDRSLERAARSFIEPGPTRAPDAAVEAALVRIQMTRQERDWHVPRRYHLMPNPIRWAALAATVIVATVAGMLVLRPGAGSVGGTGPSAIPSSAPTQTAGASATAMATGAAAASPSVAASPPAIVQLGSLGSRFTSPRNGYSIALGSGWTTVPATKPWSGNDGPDVAGGYIDVLSAPGIRLYAMSAPLGRQTAAVWRNAYAARFGLDGVGVCDVLPANWPRIPVGPVTGYLDGNACPGDGTVVPGDTFFEAQAFTGGRVYLFWLQGAIDRSTLDALLATLRLTPGNAIDTP